MPVYVMLPLDTIKVVKHPDGSSESCIQNEISLDIALQTLKSVGVQVNFQSPTVTFIAIGATCWCDLTLGRLCRGLCWTFGGA